MNNSDLMKACPFCGGKKAIGVFQTDKNYNGPGRYAVACWECDMLFGYDQNIGGLYEDEASAIEDWNKRAGDPG